MDFAAIVAAVLIAVWAVLAFLISLTGLPLSLSVLLGLLVLVVVLIGLSAWAAHDEQDLDLE